MWAFKLSSNARDFGNRIKADNNGNLYTTGSYAGILDFNPDPNQSLTLSIPLYTNYYFAKYGSAPLSIPVRLSQNELSAYPNPTSGEINIDLGDAVSAAEIRIFTLTGQEVNKLKFVNTSKLRAQLEGPNGIYILKIISDNYNSVIKLVKQ
ncbi:MAG: T9SS type A sorting domain-containing protein [Bacteroidetes bacterium]|nr:T9SS type A sorting domain-containing protein [Bacteroidota bacterium]